MSHHSSSTKQHGELLRDTHGASASHVSLVHYQSSASSVGGSRISLSQTAAPELHTLFTRSVRSRKVGEVRPSAFAVAPETSTMEKLSSDVSKVDTIPGRVVNAPG